MAHRGLHHRGAPEERGLTPDLAERLSAALTDRYRIERQLGMGGMALVYLAHDAKHDRRVALKLLRPELAAVLGADRFLQEIKVTAHLQHPHILPLHDSGEVDGLVFYVMPYVEGESLRDRLQREKQLGIAEAIEITRAVASALDYAHRHGVIHRDIKPENILLHDGQPLVADFGIALAVSAAAGGTRLTETGLSLGTPHYMSPEQAMGDRQLDARSDVYSLAAVLYEMLAGEPPYTGPTAQAIVAKVITEKPVALTLRRDTVPPHVAAAIHKALAKLPADRFRSAAEFADALARPSAVWGVVPEAARERRAWWAIRLDPWRVALGATAVVAAAGWLWSLRRPEPSQPVARFQVPLLVGSAVASIASMPMLIPGPQLSISADGSSVVYVGPSTGGRGGPMLWLRRLDRLEPAPIPGTEGGVWPAVSPDGRAVAFITAQGELTPRSGAAFALKVTPVTGGPPVTLTDSAVAHSWGPDGFIYFTRAGGIWRIPAAGGTAERLTQRDSAKGERNHVRAEALPKGRGVLFTIARATLAESDIAVVSLRTREIKILARGVHAHYGAPGYLVYARSDRAVLAAPFDASRMELTGPAIPVLEDVMVNPGGAAQFALSGNGTLLYLTGGAVNKQLVWVGRDGAERQIAPALRRNFLALALARDGARLAVSIAADGGATDLWTYDTRQPTLSRLTFDGQLNDRPAWTPDGRRVTFVSDRTGTRVLYTIPWDGSGSADSVPGAGPDVFEAEWSHDGAWLVLRHGSGCCARDVSYLRPGVDTARKAYLASGFNETAPALSPDGRWLAYVSDESGGSEVYVRPFPGPGGRWQVSNDGGGEPLWAHSGRELFYRNAGGDLIAVAVQTQPTFTMGARHRLFSTTPYESRVQFQIYDVTPDDRRFVFVKPIGGSASLVVVMNWFEDLKR